MHTRALVRGERRFLFSDFGVSPTVLQILRPNPLAFPYSYQHEGTSSIENLTIE